MTESEMEIHQRIDVMGDRIEGLEKIVGGSMALSTVWTHRSLSMMGSV